MKRTEKTWRKSIELYETNPYDSSWFVFNMKLDYSMQAPFETKYNFKNNMFVNGRPYYLWNDHDDFDYIIITKDTK